MARRLYGEALTRVLSNIDQWIRPVEAWLAADALTRDPNHLPAHRATIGNLCEVMSDMYAILPPNTYREIRHRLRRDGSLLTRLHNNLVDLVGANPDIDITAEGLDVEIGPHGRKRAAIDKDDLQYYTHLRYTDKELGEIFGVSASLIKTRRYELDIYKRERNPLSDADMETLVLACLHEGSGDQGYRMVHSALRSAGHLESRDRVQEILVNIRGPQEMSRREARVGIPRVYETAWANAMWHMDGHHKLVRWKFVIHGCMDARSRAITFLHASDNNRKETVGELFVEAVRKWDWPECVRVDHGGENLMVKAMMEDKHGEKLDSAVEDQPLMDLGEDQLCFIQANSQGNQRIERVWVDVQIQCTNKIADLFSNFEYDGILDIGDPLDLWTLHFCFKGMLNMMLKVFVKSWNEHGIRTQGGKSPLRLWDQSRREMRRIDPYHEHAMNTRGPAVLDFRAYGAGRNRGREYQDPDLDNPKSAPCTPPKFLLHYQHREALEDPVFIEELSTQIGSFFPIPQDLGRARYEQARFIVRQYLDFEVEDLGANEDWDMNGNEDGYFGDN